MICYIKIWQYAGLFCSFKDISMMNILFFRELFREKEEDNIWKVIYIWVYNILVG